MASFQGIRLVTPPGLKGYKVTGMAGFVDLFARRAWLIGRWVLPNSGHWHSQVVGYDLDSGQECYRLDTHEYVQWLYWLASHQRLFIGFAGPAWCWDRPEEPGLRLNEAVCPNFRNIALWKQQRLLGIAGKIKNTREDPDDLLLFDPAGLQVLQSWSLPHPISRLAICSVSGQIAIAGQQGKVFQLGWGPAPDQLSLTGAPGKEITSLTWLPDGGSLAVGRLDGQLEIWDTSTVQVRQILAHGATVRQIVPDSAGQLYTSANDRLIRQWDLATGQQVRHWSGHTDYITDLALAADGKYLYSGSADRTIRWWDL